MPDTKDCVNCGVKNNLDAKKCQKCGGVIFRHIVAGYRAKVCIKCQIAFSKNDNNCPKCGAQLVNCYIPKCVHCGGRVFAFCAGCGLPPEKAMKYDLSDPQKAMKVCTYCLAENRLDAMECHICEKSTFRLKEVEMEKLICPKCLHRDEGDMKFYKFCCDCGAMLVLEKALPKCDCGHSRLPHEKFCPNCGLRVK